MLGTSLVLAAGTQLHEHAQLGPGFRRDDDL